MNKELYQKFGTAVEYFQCGEQFGKLETELKQKINNAKHRFREDKDRGEGKFTALSIVSILGLIGFGFFFIAALIAFFVEYESVTASDYPLLIVPLIVIALCITVLVILNARENAHDKKFKNIYQTTVQPQIDAANAELANLENAVNEFVAKNIHLIEFLPVKYRDIQAVTFMFCAVSDGRADSLKEAINLYEEQLHRWKLENAAQRAAEMQQYMGLAMHELNMRQAETNNLLREIEAIQFMDYVNKKSN